MERVAKKEALPGKKYFLVINERGARDLLLSTSAFAFASKPKAAFSIHRTSPLRLYHILLRLFLIFWVYVFLLLLPFFAHPEVEREKSFTFKQQKYSSFCRKKRLLVGCFLATKKQRTKRRPRKKEKKLFNNLSTSDCLSPCPHVEPQTNQKQLSQEIFHCSAIYATQLEHSQVINQFSFNYGKAPGLCHTRESKQETHRAASQRTERNERFLNTDGASHRIPSND